MPNNGKNDVSGWVGWVYFAGILMVITGIFQAIAGLTALLSPTYYAVGEKAVVAFNYNQWGWIHLLLGALIGFAGVAVINGSVWGRVIGVVMAVLSIIANFAFVGAYPFWSILVMVIDVLVIYALTVHGDEVRD
jgi:hypothetical protein